MADKPSFLQRLRARLYNSVRGFFLGTGRTEKAADRKARRIAEAGASEFRAATVAERRKLGVPKTTKLYVLKGAKVTKKTPTISERAYRNKVAVQYGATADTITRARAEGRAPPREAVKREAAVKAKATRFEDTYPARIKKLVARGGTIPNNSPSGRAGSGYRVSVEAGKRVMRNRALKLRGGTIEDQGEWCEMMDYETYFDDPQIEILRSSPGAYGVRTAI